MKNIKELLGVFIVGLVLSGVFGFAAVQSFSGSAQNVAEDGGLINVYNGSSQDVGGLIGGTRFPNGLSADGTSPSSGEVRGTTLTVTGASTLTGALTVSGDLTSAATIVERLTVGGAVLETATSGTAITLTESDLELNGLIETDATGGDLTYTLPATSTLTSWIANAGDRADTVFANVGSSNNVIIEAGTGIDLEYSTTTLSIAPGNSGILDCFRLSSTDVTCVLEVNADAD